MKYIKILSIFMITLSLISCGSDESEVTQQEVEDTLKVIKKTEGYRNGELLETIEYFYDNNTRIQSIDYTIINDLQRTYSASYTGNLVTEISITSDYVNPNGPDGIQIYNDITHSENSIILISDDTNRTLEIYHSNGYVDSIKSYDTANQNFVYDEIFTRNSANQITSITEENLVYTYSNHDDNKKIDPSGSGMTFENEYVFKILNLKITKNNPLTLTVGGTSYEHFLEYDEYGYVTRSLFDENSGSYSEHQYIQL